MTSYRSKESDELLYTVLVTRYGPQSVASNVVKRLKASEGLTGDPLVPTLLIARALPPPLREWVAHVSVVGRPMQWRG